MQPLSSQEVQRFYRSPPLPELALELDELVHNKEHVESCDGDDEYKNNDSKTSHKQCQLIDHDAQRMEPPLQRNLKQQLAHYERQCQMVRKLQTESLASSFESTFFHDQKSTTFEDHLDCPLSVSEDNWSAKEEATNTDTLRFRIKGQACTEAQSKCVLKSEKIHSDAPATSFERMDLQESSNDALSRQLKLFSRVQLENNRFRQEMRVLREQNEGLKRQNENREEEVKRLREQVFKVKVFKQRSQVCQATAGQMEKKVKMMQKTIMTTQAENCDLQAALQEARDLNSQLRSECQLEVSELKLQIKRWKRKTKQLYQQEHHTNEDIEWYKKTILSLEQDVIETRSIVDEKKHELDHFATLIKEKTIYAEFVETSAAHRVAGLKERIEKLQEEKDYECRKRREVETVRCNLGLQTERMQAENALLLEKQRELEQQNGSLQEHLEERKQALQHQLEKETMQREEHLAKQKSDAAVMKSLRDDYAILDTRFKEVQAGANELKTLVADEARGIYRHAEALRQYVEKALDDTGHCDAFSLLDQEDLDQSCREAQVPELLVVRDAVSKLQAETTTLVLAFQRLQHVVCQQKDELVLAIDHAAKLEQLRAQDAEKKKELREQRKVAEEAREIVNQEKREILKWSEQNCKREKEVKTELTKCEGLVYTLRKMVHSALETDHTTQSIDFDRGESLVESFLLLKKEVDNLVAMKFHWRSVSEKHCNDVKEVQAQMQRLEEDIATKMMRDKKTVDEIERVYNNKTQVQQLYFEKCVAHLTNEQTSLQAKLQDVYVKVAEKERRIAELQQMLNTIEGDLPEFVSILHLFSLVVQPLLLQVGDLQAQKRYLLLENAEFAQIHQEIECVGHVLRDIMPATVQEDGKLFKGQRRRVFRRAVFAVFAVNRFRTPAIDHQSPYGVSAPVETSRRKACAMIAQSLVIKVLLPRQSLSIFDFRPLLDRLKKIDFSRKMAEVTDLNSTLSRNLPVYLGNLICSVVVVLNPALKELFAATDDKRFHRKERRAQHDGLPTTALIRKGILALGKQVKDLHYLRNLLQRENDEFQSQLDEQTDSLKEMHNLLTRTEELQHEMAALRSQTDNELHEARGKFEAKCQEIQLKEADLIAAQAKITTLQSEFEKVEVDKLTLQREFEQSKNSCVQEEEKAKKLTLVARRLDEEVRSLKQAIKTAHDLYQKVSWQLEQEVQEKATLHTMVNQFRQKEKKTACGLRKERLQEVEKNVQDDKCAERLYTKTSISNKTYDEKATSPIIMSRDHDFIAHNFDPCACDTTQSPHERNGKDNVHDGIYEYGEDIRMSSSVLPLPPRELLTKFSRSKDVEGFMRDWQHLNVSMAFLESPKENLLSEKRRREKESDKLNAIMFDYMDKMDNKLNQVYGIPPSSVIQRSTLRLDTSASKELRSSDKDIEG